MSRWSTQRRSRSVCAREEMYIVLAWGFVKEVERYAGRTVEGRKMGHCGTVAAVCSIIVWCLPKVDSLTVYFESGKLKHSSQAELQGLAIVCFSSLGGSVG